MMFPTWLMMPTFTCLRRTAPLTLAGLLLAGPGLARPGMQGSTPADLATKMSGLWRLNESLSPGLAQPPARGRSGGAGRGALFAVAAPAFQRGGRGGGGAGGGGGADSPIMSEEVAAQAALGVIQQVPSEVTITAGADSIEFVEPRGRSQFKIDGKTTTVEVPGGTIRVKSRWDRGTLRQEFSSTQRTLKRSWSIDDRAHLVLAQHIESISLMTKEARAVFDRQ
jgi:hypothetical protein